MGNIVVMQTKMCYNPENNKFSIMQQERLFTFRKNEFTLCNWEPAMIP